MTSKNILKTLKNIYLNLNKNWKYKHLKLIQNIIKYYISI